MLVVEIRSPISAQCRHMEGSVGKQDFSWSDSTECIHSSFQGMKDFDADTMKSLLSGVEHDTSLWSLCGEDLEDGET
eukprot:12276640-Ditylum_brightwellii.AAC.1